MAPESLTFTTSTPFVGGDEVLISRAGGDTGVAFIQITERDGGTGAAFFTLEETLVMIEQLQNIVQDAVAR